MAATSESAPTSPDHEGPTIEEERWEALSVEELKALKETLEAEITEHKRVIKEKDAVIEKDEVKKPRVKAALDKLRADRKKSREEGELADLEKKREDQKEKEGEHISNLKQYIARVEVKYFVETTPERYFFDPDFMRYVPGNKYKALMTSDRLNADEKELATKARFQFCFDWQKTPEIQEYKRERKKYLDDYDDWLKEVKTNPDVVEPKEPTPPTDGPVAKEIGEMFRNDIRTIDEYAIIHNYFPELFDQFDFVGHTRFPTIAEMRRSPEFAGRGRHIREVKMSDFLDDIIKPHLEQRGLKGNGKASTSVKYFETFNARQLASLRKRMAERIKGKERTEISGGGSRTWKSPITLDSMDRTICRGFGNSDEGDKRIIAAHCLIALASEGSPISSENKDALSWMRKERTGRAFYSVDDDFVREVEAETGLKIQSKLDADPINYKLGLA